MDERPKSDTLFRDNWIRFLPALILLILLSILAAVGIWRFDAAFNELIPPGWMFWYALVFSVIFIPLVGAYLITTVSQTIKLEYAEAALKESFSKLSQSAEASATRNRLLTLLNEMSNMLQEFETTTEAIEAIKVVVPKIFFNVSGAVYLINASTEAVEVKAAWGEDYAERTFHRDACVALRRGAAYMSGKDQGALRCGHVGEPPPASHICVPMMAQNKTFGLMFLSSPNEIGEETYDMAQTVAEHLALTLTNINLRMILKEQSVTDPLTMLFNRRFMENLFEREIRRADRGKTDLGIIMIDIDHFKEINDTYGHAAGDTVLETIGIFLRASVRMEDYVCRYGGDEFLLVMPGSSKKHTFKRADDIRKRAENLNHIHDGMNVGPLTLSGGVAAYPSDGSGKNALIEAADAALYTAKESGRNQIKQAKTQSQKKK